jgi:hypothetical protein
VRQRLGALGTVQQLVLVVVVALAVGAATATVPILNSPGLLLACGALVAAAGVLVQWLWQSRGSTDWTHTFHTPPATRGADVRIARIADDVRAAAAGDAAAADRLHATVSSLAADQLRLRRGISLVDDPQEAHAALGPELAAYLAQPPPARLTGDRLAAFTTTLEEL